jgi:multicomponent Na+:H+ antiporter subunit G
MSTTDVIASILIILGAVMSLLAGIAVLRFPDTMSRIHAATKPQVLGIILLMVGLGLRLQSAAVVGVLVLIVLLQFVTAPVSAHLTVRVAYRNATEHPDTDEHRPGADDSPAEYAEPATRDGGQPGRGSARPGGETRENGDGPIG